MDSNTPPPGEEVAEESLDGPVPAETTTVDATSATPTTLPPAPKPKGGLKHALRRFNIYLLLFFFILMIAGAITTIAYFQSKKANVTSTLKAQTLTQQTLQQVANSDATIGNAQQILNVQSSAVFAGKVLIRDGLEVAGNLQIGGTLAISSISVSGAASVGKLQVNKDIAVAGDASVQGGLAVAKNLQVTGGGSFSGPVTAPQITTTSLQLNGDLLLTHHITTGGGTPGRNPGPALGSGGSATVGGSDTGGTVSINTGSGTSAGCLITVNFTSKYNATPHVLLTPVGASGGGVSYYVNRDTASFSICVSTPAPSGASFGFDYFVVD